MATQPHQWCENPVRIQTKDQEAEGEGEGAEMVAALSQDHLKDQTRDLNG